MRYLKVLWNHSFENEPIIIYSEIDDNDWESRKIEIFRDGHSGFSDGYINYLGTTLGQVPIPNIETIAASSEFEPYQIKKEEFEDIWSKTQNIYLNESDQK